MTFTMPPEVPAWVVAAVAGPMPEGDEDAMRRVGHAWIELGDVIAQVAELTGAARQKALAVIAGETGTALAAHGIDLDGDLHTAANACYSLGEQLLNNALYTEYTKYVIAGSLVAQLAVDAFAPGIGEAEGVAQTAATRMTIRAAVRELVANLGRDGARAAAARLGKMVLFKGATLGAVQGGLIPAAADTVQMVQGNRRWGDFDWREIGLGVVSGGAAGMAGEFFGGKAIAGMDRRVSGAAARNAAHSPFLGRAVVRFTGAAIGGGAGAVAGVVAIAPFTGSLDFSWKNLLPGIVGGVIGTLPHALRVHGPSGPPPPPGSERIAFPEGSPNGPDGSALRVPRDPTGLPPNARVGEEGRVPVVRDGGPVTREGEPVTREGEPVTREGESVTREGESVTRDGESVTREGEPVTRDGESVTREGESVTREGEPVTREGESVTREGESVTREGEPVTREGESVTREGESVTREGEPVTRDGEPVTRTGEPVLREAEGPVVGEGGPRGRSAEVPVREPGEMAAPGGRAGGPGREVTVSPERAGEVPPRIDRVAAEEVPAATVRSEESPAETAPAEESPAAESPAETTMDLGELRGVREGELQVEGDWRDREFMPELDGPRQTYLKSEFIEMWENKLGRKLFPIELRTLDRGCIGVTMLSIGRDGHSPPMNLAFSDPGTHYSPYEFERVLGPLERANEGMNQYNRWLREATAELAAARQVPGAGDDSPEIRNIQARVDYYRSEAARYEQAAEDLAKNLNAQDKSAWGDMRTAAKLEHGQRTKETVLGYKHRFEEILAQRPATREDFLAMVAADPVLGRLRGVDQQLPSGSPADWDVVMYAKHFYSGQAYAYGADGKVLVDSHGHWRTVDTDPNPRAFAPDPATAQVDMSSDLFGGKGPGICNFDYGRYVEETDSWLSGNHMEFTDARRETDPMRVIHQSDARFHSYGKSYDSAVIALAFRRVT
ncbi:hypothetical protein [Nocardia sp. alder85J]|uniref:WXG100-like domain-containing protein n=1 Tax=Nocardia sp. alder85J TaxID=2862949 RepID=UPI001CD4D1E2|nr:hypothetical protein [Nocardia sp. alder85J]MCX4095145.1 hypothetical protein [Nocardia sp. alder85J]